MFFFCVPLALLPFLDKPGRLAKVLRRIVLNTGTVALLSVCMCNILFVFWGGKLLLRTKGKNVLFNRKTDVSALQPCNHAKDDTRIFLHLAHAAAQGHKIAIVRTVDSDVVVLAIHFFSSHGFLELWVCFGSGKKVRDITIHDICAHLGPSRSLTLPLFHAITGCDTTSQFLGCDTKYAWTSWQNIPGLTETLMALTNNPNLHSLDSLHVHAGSGMILWSSCTARDVD